MCVKRERKGGEHSGGSSWRAKKGGGRGEGRVRKLVWLAEQLFTPLSPLHHHPPLLFPILLCILWRWQGESFIAPSWYRSGPLSEGSQTCEYRRHFCNVHNLPPYLSFLLLLYISFSFCFAFSHTLILCHLCGLGIQKSQFGDASGCIYLSASCASAAGCRINSGPYNSNMDEYTQTYRSLIPSSSA